MEAPIAIMVLLLKTTEREDIELERGELFEPVTVEDTGVAMRFTFAFEAIFIVSISLLLMNSFIVWSSWV